MSTATLETTDRAEWLEWRKTGIGASDTPAILGIDPYRSPLDVYYQKTGEREEEPANLPCRVGLALEPLIQRLYEEETGRKIVETQVRVSNECFPYMLATIDGMTDDGRIVEFKTTQSYSKGLEIGEEGTDEIPATWLAQVVHQQILSPSEHMEADVAILRGNSKFSVHTVKYDHDLGKIIVNACAEFWQRIQDRNPPPATRGSDCRVLAKLYPEAEGETAIGEVGEYLVEQWEAANRDSKVLADMAAKYKAQLLGHLAGYSVARLPDGRILKRSVSHVKERIQTVKAHDQVRLTISKGESR